MQNTHVSRTPLFDAHQKLSAKMIDFNGWLMPLQYATINSEHNAVRQKCGVFDTCHMGEFYLRAPDVRDALNKLLTGDFHQLAAGRMRYTFITDVSGGVIDDAVVFLIDENNAMICVNAGDISGDFAALESHLPMDAVLTDASAQTAKIDVQGAAARDLIKQWLAVDFFSLSFYSFRKLSLHGEKIIVSRSGYTGSPGVEIFAGAALAEDLWHAALKFGAIPCGLGARDTLRLEAGLPLYGHELSLDKNPLDAGFARFVSLTKSENFCGKDALIAIASPSNKRKLRGLKIADKRIPRAGSEIINDRGDIVGTITSGAPAWTAGFNAAFAYIDNGAEKSPLWTPIRGQNIAVEISATPFYQAPDLREKI